MLKRNAQLFEGLFIATDLLVVSIAWLVSYWLRFELEIIPAEKGIPPFIDYLRSLFFVWLIWAFVFRRFGLYQPMRGIGRIREIWTVLKANSLSVLLFLALTYLFREKSVPFSRLVFVLFWGLSTVFAITSRTLIRELLRSMRRRGYNLRYAVIVGSGSLAGMVARRLQRHPEFGIELLGCLTDDTKKGAVMEPRHDGALRDELPNGVKIIGTYSDLPALLERGSIDQVIVALPLQDHDRMEAVVSSIGDAMVDVRIVPDLHRFIQLGSLVEEFDGLPVISLASTPLEGYNRILKRGLDIVLGGVFLVIALPMMVLTAILVKLTSKGPIFYTQERVGLDGNTFRIYKFRTMAINAEANGAKWCVPADPRVTPLGRVLRKFNIDELPQLLNVIAGTMSLVGPRPERPVFIREFRQRVPRYMLRHKVQAGMTGWAQVHGWRGNTSIERRIEHDLYYIEHWSLGLDLKILGLTLLNSFRDRNAY